MQMMMISAEEIVAAQPDLSQDSEEQSFPTQGPDIDEAREMFMPEERNADEDLVAIIHSCLKDAKRSKARDAIKTLSQLTAVLEYVILCA